MAEKIDYKEYLKQFGKIETDSKNRIKAYLEEQIKEDAALRDLYRPEKISDCYNFIKEAVRATGCGNSATIEDAVVFKMARDYFIDILPKQTDEPAEVKDEEVMLHQADDEGEESTDSESEAETESATEEEKPADNENEAKKEYCGFEVFGEEAPEEGAETAATESAEAETEQAETKEETPADNENTAESKPENEKPEPFIPKYDEDGNGLLFEF